MEGEVVGRAGSVYFSALGDAVAIKEVHDCRGKLIRRLASTHNGLFVLCDNGTVTIHGDAELSAYDWVAIAHGSKHSIGQTAAGQLFVWGSNSYGQLGIGAGGAELVSPTQLPLKAAVEKVASNATHSAAADINGDLYVWGANFQGQLALHQTGQADALNRESVVLLPRFVPFSASNKIASVACGEGFTLVATMQGAVWGWGASDCGQVGVQRKSMIALPEQILECDPEDGSPIHTVVCGWAHALCASSSGNVFSWGLNSHGQLGRVTTTTSSSQPALLNLDPCTKLYTKTHMSAAITDKGQLFTWGLNNGHALLHDGLHTLRLPHMVEAYAGIELADICFSVFGTAVLVYSKIYSLRPTLAPWNQASLIELQGGGLYAGDDTVVRFTHEMSQRPGRAAFAKDEPGESFVNRVTCTPPMLTQPGAYRVELALDGITFLQAGWIQFYEPAQLTGCLPPIIDIVTANESAVSVVFQCDQAIDPSLALEKIRVKLEAEDGQIVILRTTQRLEYQTDERLGTSDGCQDDAEVGQDTANTDATRKAIPVATKLKCTWDVQQETVQLPFVAHMSLSLNDGVDWSTAPKQQLVIHNIQLHPKSTIWCSLAPGQNQVKLTGEGFVSTTVAAYICWEDRGPSGDVKEVGASSRNGTADRASHELPVHVRSSTSLTIEISAACVPRVAASHSIAYRGFITLTVNGVELYRPELPLQVICYHEQSISSTTSMVCTTGGNTVRIQFGALQYPCETMVVQLKITSLDWEELIPAQVIPRLDNDTRNEDSSMNGDGERQPTTASSPYEVVCLIPVLPEAILGLPEEGRVMQLRLLPNGTSPTESVLSLPIYQLPSIQRINPPSAKSGAKVTVTLDRIIDCSTAMVRLRSIQDDNVVVHATVTLDDNSLTFVVPNAVTLSPLIAKNKLLSVDISLDGEIYTASSEAKLMVK